MTQAEAEVVRLKSTPPVTHHSALDDILQRTDQILADCSATEEVKVEVDSSVCSVFDFDAADFSDISVDNVIGQLSVNCPLANGNRLTSYFGIYRIVTGTSDTNPANIQRVTCFLKSLPV